MRTEYNKIVRDRIPEILACSGYTYTIATMNEQAYQQALRPLHVLFNACFQAGFSIDGLEEPAFDSPNDGSKSTNGRLFSWVNYAEILPVLVVRLRVAC